MTTAAHRQAAGRATNTYARTRVARTAVAIGVPALREQGESGRGPPGFTCIGSKRYKMAGPSFIVCLCGLTLCSSIARPQAKRSSLTSDVETLIGMAAGLQPEYANDILLQLVEAGKITDVVRRAAILEMVFESASRAVYHFKLVDVISDTDTRTRRLGFSFSERLDALSIRLRAVQAILKTIQRGLASSFYGFLLLTRSRPRVKAPWFPTWRSTIQ